VICKPFGLRGVRVWGLWENVRERTEIEVRTSVNLETHVKNL